MHWSTHPLRLVTMLAAPVGEYKDLPAIGRYFFGNAQRPWSMWSESLYLGVPVLGLAVLGTQRRDIRVFAVLGLAALVMALGRYGGLYELFYRVVPFWSAFRYPEKLMGVVAFAAAMLAGAGLDALRTNRARPAMWLIAAAVCAGAWLGLGTETAAAWATAGFGAPDDLSRSVADSAARAFLFSGIASFGVGLAVAGGRSWFPAGVAAIIVVDLFRATFPAYHTAPAASATFIPPLAQALARSEGVLHPGRFRLISLRDSQYMAPEDMGRLYGHDVQAVERRQALGLEHNAEFHIETVFYYLPPDPQAVLPPNLGLEAAARFNVAYYIGHRDHFRNPRFEGAVIAELPDYDLALAHNPVPASPRAYLSARPEAAAGPVDLPRLLRRPDFLNGQIDVIEAPAGILPGPSAGGTARIERYSPEEVRIRVDAPERAVLILMDTFDAGWTAALDSGSALPLLRANALCRAVIVPAGSHTVTFRYETPLLSGGAAASAAGALLCLAIIGSSLRRTRDAKEPA